MALATRFMGVTVEVTDQDRALAVYRDVLGCAVLVDAEIWPGASLVEVAPPDSPVHIALSTRDSGLPIGVRCWTGDAEVTHRALAAAGAMPNEEVLVTDFAPPMFTVDDPDGNTVILIQDEPQPENASRQGTPPR